MSLPLPRLNADGSKALDELLAKTVAQRHVPAVFFLATNARETIYSNQAGEVTFGDASSGEVDEDTTLELFSQTKFITAIAALQCVDRGLVDLDSEDDVAKYLPEIAQLPVITGYDDDGKPKLQKAEKKVTLRQLLSHSAGCIYFHSESLLSKYISTAEDTNIFASSATIKTLAHPLIYEPGTSWAYSTSIDWAGKLVERASGQRLDKFFAEHIFTPSGATSLTFFPTDEIKAHKMGICYRKPDGEVALIPGGFGMGRPSTVDTVSTELLLGGAGLFGTNKDYLAVLRKVLQSAPNAPADLKGNKPLLSENAYAELWKGCVSDAGKEEIVKMVSKPAYFDPAPTVDNLDHSVGFLLNKEDFVGRRKAGSGCWSGAAKTQFWIDPSTGLAGICATQLLSPSPDPWYASYCEYERVLYAHLTS